MVKMKFYLPFEKLPTYTAQQKRLVVIKGKPRFFPNKREKETRQLLRTALLRYVPEQPIDGAVEFRACWRFGIKQKKRHGLWKVTRPDTDNLNKLLKDVMTELGFWKDDSQVVLEHIGKQYTSRPGLYVEIRQIDERAGDDDDLNRQYMEMD